MKLLVALILIVALIALGVLVVKKLNQKQAKADAEITPEQKTAQSLINIADIKGHVIITTTGTHVVLIKVDGHNYSLSTREEKEHEAQTLAIALGAETNPYKIHRIQKPVDVTIQLANLRNEVAVIDDQIYTATQEVDMDYHAEKRIEALRARKYLLEEIYIPQCMEENTSLGTKYITETYISMAFSASRHAEEIANQTSNAFVKRLQDAGFSAHKMEPDEIVIARMNYYGRYPVATERTTPRKVCFSYED